jgi:hypothetical protein
MNEEVFIQTEGELLAAINGSGPRAGTPEPIENLLTVW